MKAEKIGLTLSYFYPSGLNFINVLRAAFMPADPKSISRCSAFFMLSGSTSVKAERRMLMKWHLMTSLTASLISVVNFINVLRAHFLYENALRSFSLVMFLGKKQFHTQNTCVKCWWNWHLVSVVPHSLIALHKIPDLPLPHRILPNPK